MTQDPLLNALGTWQKPVPYTDQRCVEEYLRHLLADTPAESPNYPYLKALVAQFCRLAREEYFSEAGQKLTMRLLCEALDTARNVNACRSLADVIDIDADSIAKIVDSQIYRDGGSRSLLARTSAGIEIEFFLATGPQPKTYTELYPCSWDEMDFFVPIQRGTPEDEFVLNEVAACLARDTALSPEVRHEAHLFLEGARNRSAGG